MRKNLLNEIEQLYTAEQSMCDAEKERIMLHLKKEIRTTRSLPIIAKGFSTAAACFMLLIIASVFNPVLAESIPFMQEIVSFLKQEHAPVNTVISESDFEKYTRPAVDSTEDELKILETYCDGTALVVTAELELPGIDKDIMRIVPLVTADINNERLFPVKDAGTVSTEKEGQRLGMFMLHRAEGDRFVGVLSMDVSHLDLTDAFAFTLTLTELTGENPKLMVAASENANNAVYAPKQYAIENVTVPHTVTVPVDTDLRREYTVGKMIGPLTVHKLITTPACTYLDVSGNENSAYFYTLTTESGEELSSNKFDNSGLTAEDRSKGMIYRNPLPVGTESVTITVYDDKNDSVPVDSIEIPVDRGYTSPKDAYTVAQIPESEIVYDPPLAELPALQEKELSFELGETIISREGRDPNDDGAGYENEDSTLEITYNNMRVYDSPAEIGLSANKLIGSSHADPLEKEDRKFVTFDVTLKTNGIYGYRFEDEEYRSAVEAYTKNDGTAGVLWINHFATVETLNGSEPTLFGEAAYFSLHPDNSTNYYRFVTNAYDTHSLTVGFYVPDTLLETGEWRIAVATGESDPNTGRQYAYYNIPSVSLNK